MFYLPDKQGNLQPVLDFQYQDFVELYKLKNQLERRDEPPRYSIQRMSAIGTAAADSAELTLQIQTLVHDDNWVRIPLRLDQALLRGATEHRGPGEMFIHFDGNGDGYVCWIRGKAESQHDVTLTFLVPLATIGEEKRLRLFAPRATASELKLTVPMTDAAASVSDGATLLPPVAKKDATELTVVGFGGDFQLTWHKPSPRIAETPAVLEAVGAVLVRIDGRSITSDATLSVRSFGAAFDRFTVQLPPDAELTPTSGSGYTATPIAPNGKADGEPGRVEVRLAKKTAGPIDVRLTCHRPYDPQSDRSLCELAGFDVMGAPRQWGVTAVAADADWQVLWGPGRGVRQVDQLPDPLRRSDVLAGFEYSAQPYSLPARLVPRGTRVSVEPEYVLLVDRDQIRLDGKLTYTVRGAKVAAFEVSMPGWELGEIGPDDVVAVDGVTMDSSGVVTIPLIKPSSGQIELQLDARRAIAPGAASLTVPLPQPQAVASAPLCVAVVSADDIELTPQAAAIEGLVRQRSAPPMKLRKRQQEPLYYRGTGAPAVFAADLRYHTRQIDVDVSSQLTFNRQTVAVEQKFSYQVDYEPIDRLTVAIPRALAGVKRLEFSFNGKPLAIPLRKDAGSRDESSRATVERLALPGPQIGRCELLVRYALPAPRKSSENFSVPLVMPDDGELQANNLSVKAGPETQTTPLAGVWSAVAGGADRDGGGLLLSASRRAAEIVFEVRREDAEGDALLVDRAWVQSWLTYSARQDRAVFQFATHQREVEVTLPAGIAAKQISVTLDGRRVDYTSPGEDRLLVPLSGEGGRRRYVLELRYNFPDARPPRGVLRLDFPRLDGDAWLRRMYWQLVLPRNEHVISNPDGFTSEFRWQWEDYFWGRQPLLDQAELETWSDATPRAALPDGCNLYLFSAMGEVDHGELRTASRSWIVLWASGAALVAGLLLIYVPASRHPAVLLVVSLSLLATGAVAPEPTLMLAQAASLGLALTLLAGLLERGVARRRRRTAILEPSSSRIELGSTHAHVPSPAMANSSSREQRRQLRRNPRRARGNEPSRGMGSVAGRANVGDGCRRAVPRRGGRRAERTAAFPPRSGPRRPHEGLARRRRKVSAPRCR